MPLVYACIAPHGGELIPRLAGKQRRLFAETTRGMWVLGKDIQSARPETIVVSTPHNLRLQKHIGVVVSEFTSGKLGEGGVQVSMKTTCDREFAQMIILEAEKRDLPVVGANYGGLEGPLSDVAMDWGTLVPLWFLRRGPTRKCRVVVVTPSRGIPLNMNYEFGRAIGKVAKSTRKRIAFVASSDQAHAHSKKGPYGFSPYAAKYDAMVVEAVRSGRIASVMDASPRLVEGAKPDSLWQMTMLAGALSDANLVGELVSYQVPTYYGMLCASYTQ